MILTCPNCGTQYVVKDDAIPPQGRQVRCASCKHSWHQEPPQTPELDLTEDQETLAEATMIEPRGGLEAEERAFEAATLEGEQGETAAEPVEPAEPVSPEPPPEEERAEEAASLAAEQRAAEVSADIDEAAIEPPTAVAADWNQPPQPEPADDEFSPFPAADEAEPRRRSPLLAILALVILVVALAVAFYFYAPPEWKARLGLGMGATSKLALVTTHMDRQQLESGQELLTISGRIINPTSAEQTVPPLQAQLRTRAGKVVHSWTIAPPARSLAPGASASFNSAEYNVPTDAEELTITLGEQKV